MPGKKIQNLRKLRRKTTEWHWRKNYRVWDSGRKLFLYPETWIEPDLRLPALFRVSLSELALFTRPRCDAKGVRILFTGKNRPKRFVAAQTLARDLGKDLYRIDLNVVVSKYIGETEKNLGRVFDAAKGKRSVLFFDEADALFCKRSVVKDSHDRYANIEINYLLRKAEKFGGLAILAAGDPAKINKALMPRFHFIIPIPGRKKPQRKESPTC
jgi:hypothetical protein